MFGKFNDAEARPSWRENGNECVAKAMGLDGHDGTRLGCLNRVYVLEGHGGGLPPGKGTENCACRGEMQRGSFVMCAPRLCHPNRLEHMYETRLSEGIGAGAWRDSPHRCEHSGELVLVPVWDDADGDRFGGGCEMNCSKKMRVCLAFVLLAALLSGCRGTRVHFDNVPVEKMNLSQGRPIKGSASGFQLFVFAPLGVNGRQARAYEHLKEAAQGEYISNIEVQESWRYAFIGTVYKTTFFATAYPDKGMVPDAQNNGAVGTLTQKLKELKVLHDQRLLSDEEFELARKKALEQMSK